MKKNNDLNQTINVNVAQNEGKSGGGPLKIADFIKKTVYEIENTSFKNILKLFTNVTVICASFLLVFFCWHIAKDQNMANKVINKVLLKEKDEVVGMKIRDIVTPKINDMLEKYMYELKADRAVIFEIHNGKENVTHMPFRFADMSFEKTNDQNKEIAFISNQYQGIHLTDYKIPYYLSDNNYFIGDVDEAKRIDPRFGLLMEKANGHYMCATTLRSNGLDIGFLAFFYDYEDAPEESREEIQETLKKASTIFSSLLDLNIQKDKYYKDGKILEENN